MFGASVGIQIRRLPGRQWQQGGKKGTERMERSRASVLFPRGEGVQKVIDETYVLAKLILGPAPADGVLHFEFY